ncbi:sulfurtransferase [Mycobacterium vulneris]|jgi:rhodanese-related sulfurtransferase|uniref:Sulfurtransferase n=1 Tax=Mycolicibacterium vulneris TaxID=547163 RepID=A0A1X2KSX7_9MYCO|nr:rhodanese-like domain-containing protein [Mycolicibacterium vulneris]OSC24858.1 sulfurtransferase [Mycolicibacterium vulneris]
MNATSADAITSVELRTLLESPTAPRVLDVRTPAEFETAHIADSYNVPLDVLEDHAGDIAGRLDNGRDIVLVCRSGQRSTKAHALLRDAGLNGGRVLEKGIVDWERRGFAVHRGTQRWELERQVRLVAGSVVLSSVLGSVALPRLKWVAAAIGSGLTFAALTNTCAMATALSKLPYNRGATSDPEAVLSALDAEGWALTSSVGSSAPIQAP